ncbi:hypothetical protein HKX48_007364 [Thoreauomyces humboldtii]|nr:hypothetical protein HKX48_007364 [Thoreauomyces humboldtii]
MTAGRKVTVPGLSEAPVSDPVAFEKLFVSRSHFMVQLNVRIGVGDKRELTSKLSLIDLAGSEDNRQIYIPPTKFARECCFIKNNVTINESRPSRTPRAADGILVAANKPEPESGPSCAMIVPSADKENPQRLVSLDEVEKMFRPAMLSMLEERDRELATSRLAAVADIMSVMNLGSLADLKALKMIGPQRALKILKAREEGGPFHSPQDLSRIGFSDDLLRSIMLVNSKTLDIL